MSSPRSAPTRALPRSRGRESGGTGHRRGVGLAFSRICTPPSRQNRVTCGAIRARLGAPALPKPETPAMIEQDVIVTTKYGQMPSFVACPDGPGQYPGIIFYMDAPGIREELRNMTRRIAKQGYFAVLPDMYYRLGTLRFDVNRRDDEMFQCMRAAMNSLLDKHGIKHELKVFPGTEHGFAFNERAVYNTVACEETWDKMFALWGRTLK